METHLPYPGLRAFTRDESHLFFGREHCVDDLIQRLNDTRFLAVLGASGSGKSSMVHTGLIDALELGFFARAGSRWKVVNCHPGGQPMLNLALALGRSVPAEIDVLRGEALSKYLSQGPRSLVNWCREGGSPSGENLLLIVDQFEELFRYSNYAAREEAEAFVALLMESARYTDLPIYIVLTMRSEYLGACSLIPGLAEQVNAGFFLTPRMTRDECRLAIEGPAAIANFSIQPALVNQLLNDMASFAPWELEGDANQAEVLSRRADQLPLMQHLLNRLWLLARSRQPEGPLTLTQAQYNEVGGLHGALDIHGAHIISTIEPEVTREDMERVFRALVSGVDTAEAVRRPCRLDELAGEAKGGDKAARIIVERFRSDDCNFLQPRKGIELHDYTPVDISHESLIRQWDTLSDWTRKEGRDDEKWRDLVRRAQREKAKDGSLLTGLDLSSAAAWWDKEQPRKEWAERHGGHYDLAQTFLKRSRSAAKQKRLLTWGIAAAITAAFITIICIGYLSRQAALRREQADKNARLQTEKDALQQQLNLQKLKEETDATEHRNAIATLEGVQLDAKKITTEDALKKLSLATYVFQKQREDLQRQLEDSQNELAMANQSREKAQLQVDQLKQEEKRVTSNIGGAMAAKGDLEALRNNELTKHVTMASPPQSFRVRVEVAGGPADKQKGQWEYSQTPLVYIDNNPLVTIVPGTYYIAHLPAGIHKFNVSQPGSSAGRTVGFVLSADDTLVLKATYVPRQGKVLGYYVPTAVSGSGDPAGKPLPEENILAKH